MRGRKKSNASVIRPFRLHRHVLAALRLRDALRKPPPAGGPAVSFAGFSPVRMKEKGWKFVESVGFARPALLI